jgi:hypothetical protein
VKPTAHTRFSTAHPEDQPVADHTEAAAAASLLRTPRTAAKEAASLSAGSTLKEAASPSAGSTLKPRRLDEAQAEVSVCVS